jgi:RNA polymerase-binding transcription factor DksA
MAMGRDELTNRESAMKCIDCGAEIPKARLELLPNTTYCVKCSERHPPASADPNDVCAKSSITIRNGFGPKD